MSTVQTTTVVPPASQGEACPPPLMWQEVLAAFHADSLPWELTNGSRRLVGRTWGRGQPLYLLNNFAATAEMYALVLWLLKDDFYCVVYDTHSTDANGRRLPASGSRTVADDVSDLMLIADQHGDESFHIFGASYGAAVALQTALDHPRRVAGLILQNGFARRRLTFFERMLAAWYGRSQRTLSSVPGCQRVQEVNHRRWFPPFDNSRYDFLVASSGSIPLTDLAQKARAVGAFDVRSRLAEIACPTLLIRTEGEGRVAAACHEELASGLKAAHTEWLHSAGQHPSLTHPHRIAKLVKAHCGTGDVCSVPSPPSVVVSRNPVHNHE